MTTSLGKRSSVNGISDIAYKVLKAPVNTSGDQFVQGVKTYSQPIKALTDVYCYGKYYGDGSQLTNVTGLDPSKLPLAGGTITGTVNFVGPTALTIEISEIGIGLADPDNQWSSSLKPDRLAIDNGDTEFYSVTRIQSQFESAAGYNTQSASQIQLESAGGTKNLITADNVILDQGPSVTATLSVSGVSFFNVSGISSQYADTAASLQNGSFSHTMTALNQTINDGNGNSNEIDNIKVYIREDGGGKDATYGLLSSQHRNENNFNSCLTELGVNTDGNLGLSVKSQIDVDACTLFVGYNAGIPAQPEVSVSGNSFIKWNTGTSLRIRQQDGNKIEKFDAVQVNNGAYGQFDFHAYTHYLDAYGEGGWTVTLINPGNLPDPNVTSPDIYFVCNQFGASNNFTLLKWTAARIILTPCTPGIYPYDFIWLVSF